MCVTSLLSAAPFAANNSKFLSDFGIRNGSRLQADDFLQDYTLLVNVLHTYVPQRLFMPEWIVGADVFNSFNAGVKPTDSVGVGSLTARSWSGMWSLRS